MRNAFIISILLSCLSGCTVPPGEQAQAQEENQYMKLWYDEPASNWDEALPVGNGRLGAMVFGQPGRERLQINEETVWAGEPGNNVDPAVSAGAGAINNPPATCP